MKTCQNCGAQCGDSDNHCTSCGAVLSNTVNGQTNVQNVQSAPPVSQQPPVYPQQPLYPAQAPVNPAPGRGKAITGFVFGILSLFIPFVGVAFGIAGIVLSAMAMKTMKPGMQGRGFAIAGLVCSIVGLVFSIIACFFYIGIATAVDYVGDNEDIMREFFEEFESAMSNPKYSFIRFLGK